MAEIRRFYFEEGNAAQEIYEPLPSREEREAEERQRVRRIRRARNRRRAYAMRQNRLYTIYLCIGVLIFAAFFAFYVGIQSRTSEKMRHVSALKEEISEMRADNDAEENRILGSTNLAEIRDAAQNQLGMSYAGNDRIIYYSVGESDYMSQYEDLP